MMKRYGWLILMMMGFSAMAQDNAPLSRYGIGDLSPNQNMVNRAMGGITAGYSDYQSLNFSNPASYGNLSYIADKRYVKTSLRNTIFDIGAAIDKRTIKQQNPVDKFSITTPFISYMQLGLPIKLKKANAKGFFMGAALGLRPVSKIDYRISSSERIPGVDSIATLYEGSGGLNEAKVGLGIRFKNLSIGINSGYWFGSKDYSSKRVFINDTTNYYQSNSASKATFGGILFTGGFQYEINVKGARLRLGGQGNLKRSINNSTTDVRETINVDINGTTSRIDSVYEKNTSGTIVLPASYSFGFTYQDSAGHWLVGADYEKTSWSQYRFNGQTDFVKDNWKVRAGAEFYPAKFNTPYKKYFSHVRYRAGFFFGPEYVNVKSQLNEFGMSFGGGFPLKLRKSYYETQSSFLNATIEIGSRKNDALNISENFFRIGLGLSLSDIWFNRSKYF